MSTVVLSSACGGPGEEPAPEPESVGGGDRSVDPELTLGLSPDVAERRLALVDDQPVTVLDVAREFAEGGPTVGTRSQDADGRRGTLEMLVTERALAAEARRRGLDEDPAVLRAREEVLVRALVAQVAADVPLPTDEQVRATFEGRRSTYRTPERRTAGVIFTRDRAGAEAALREMAADPRHQAEIWARTADRIGFAGPWSQPRQELDLFAAYPRDGEPFVPQPVRDAVFETDPGRVHPSLVPYEDGFYLVQVNGVAEPADPSFESLRDSIRDELHAEAVDSAVTALVAEQLAEATFDEAALDVVNVPAPPRAPGARP